ncbi:MAG: hypothetical protein NC429_10015 [Lachnospiraceae bacterium]|nr:hypothetical protein [Lachnospiraceae bacterium]
MAEYKMSYNELQVFIDDAINNTCGDKDKLLAHKAEILTALTGVFADESIANQKEQNQLMELWTNQQGDKSQLLLGKRYIRIYDGMLAFLEAFLTGGLCDVILDLALGVSFPASLTVGAVSSVVTVMVKVFSEAVSLEDFDFCLYMQIVTHFYEKKEFSKDDILSWYPSGGVCNMHTSKWDCCHRGQNDRCEVVEKDIDDIVQSLYDKGILDYHYSKDKKLYHLKRIK